MYNLTPLTTKSTKSSMLWKENKFINSSLKDTNALELAHPHQLLLLLKEPRRKMLKNNNPKRKKKPRSQSPRRLKPHHRLRKKKIWEISSADLKALFRLVFEHKLLTIFRKNLSYCLSPSLLKRKIVTLEHINCYLYLI